MMFKSYCTCGRYRGETEGVNARVRDMDKRAATVAYMAAGDLATWLERYDPGCSWGRKTTKEETDVRNKHTPHD